uniref:Helicase ATP-binding domain-containing protein n=1 Tax=Syphacia muris TaxID=451379 RepID=A0A0N5AH69_9BILA
MGEEYSFPFPPYDIQLSLMKQIFDCIDGGNVGIFESPTGTGKSLSVICAALTWLEKYEKTEKARLKELCDNLHNEDDVEEVGNFLDDWVAAYRRKFTAKKKASEAEEKLEVLKKIEEKIQSLEKKIANRKRKLITDDGDYVENYNTIPMNVSTLCALGLLNLKMLYYFPIFTKQEFLAEDEYNSDCEDTGKDDEASLSCVKILYATRTHSQLEQFANEVFKTRFRPRIVTIGSRQTLCLNGIVRGLKFSNLMNEKCNELRENKGSVKIHKVGSRVCIFWLLYELLFARKAKITSHCPFYKVQAIEDLGNEILAARTSSIFKVISFGKNMCACPYFASKQAVPLCQLVLLPYQVLLHKDTRKAWGISLKNNVVIIDEAHNLLQTVASTYSAEVSESTISAFQELLQEYITRYKSMMCAKNLLYIRQLHALATSMKYLMKNYVDKGCDEIFSLENFLVRINSSEINLFKLLRYMEITRLCKKLHGFFLRRRSSDSNSHAASNNLTGIEKILQKNDVDKSNSVKEADTESNSFSMQNSSPVYSLKQFIESLTSKCADSRIIFQMKTSDNEACFKYMLLNTAEKLYDIVSNVRALILIGGTMEPADYLFHSLHKVPKEKVLRFSCEHVIDDSQLLALSLGKPMPFINKLYCIFYDYYCVGKAPSGLEITLDFKNRLCTSTMNGLAMILMNLLRFVTNGAIVFFTSYDYMYKFESYLRTKKLFEKINAIKSVTIEQKTGSTDVWNTFSKRALSARGGVLFAVVGGKLSEGINFSDELGRCVFMVGLPYPNKNDIEIIERMKYLDLTLGPGNGAEMYESLCLHAVNQAIGRVIRHRNDYAAIVLIDSRFSQQRIIKGLPCWIKPRLKLCSKFGESISLVSQFFKEKKIGMSNKTDCK